MDELAAEERRAVPVEDDGRQVVFDGQAVILDGREFVRVGRPRPRLHGARLATGLRCQLARCQAGGTGSPQPLEEPEFDADVHQPRAVEPAETGDQVVETVVESHRRADCRMLARRLRCPPGTVIATRPRRCNGPRDRVVLGIDGHRQPAPRGPGT